MNNIELQVLKHLLKWETYQKYRGVVNTQNIKELNKELYRLYLFLDEFILPQHR